MLSCFSSYPTGGSDDTPPTVVVACHGDDVSVATRLLPLCFRLYSALKAFALLNAPWPASACRFIVNFFGACIEESKQLVVLIEELLDGS